MPKSRKVLRPLALQRKLAFLCGRQRVHCSLNLGHEGQLKDGVNGHCDTLRRVSLVEGFAAHSLVAARDGNDSLGQPFAVYFTNEAGVNIFLAFG